MSVDLRLRHDRSLRERAAEMFERGLGYKSAARELGVPDEAVRNWQKTYRATGRDGLLAMGGGQARYDYETKVAAASADALGETGKGTANFFIVIGIIETVALFTLVFSLLLLQ